MSIYYYPPPLLYYTILILSYLWTILPLPMGALLLYWIYPYFPDRTNRATQSGRPPRRLGLMLYVDCAYIIPRFHVVFSGIQLHPISIGGTPFFVTKNMFASSPSAPSSFALPTSAPCAPPSASPTAYLSFKFNLNATLFRFRT